MPSEQELTTGLSRIPNWSTVSYKQELVKKLSKQLDSGETVADLIEGFYNGITLHGADTGVPGVLFITNTRVLFVASGKSRPDHESIARGDILSARTERGFATVRLVFSLAGKEVHLDTVTSASAAERAISLLTTDMDRMTVEAPASTATSTFNELSAIQDLQNEMSRIETMIGKRLHDEPLDGLRQPGGYGDMSNYNFLFLEAKKTVKLIQQYQNFGADGKVDGSFLDTLLKDVIHLCSLCFSSIDAIYEESKIFFALLILPFHAHTREFETAAREIYAGDSFPLHHKDTLLAFFRSRDWLSPAAITGKG